MNDDFDCEHFQDALDRLFEGSAIDDDLARLGEHAASCEACAMELRILEPFGAPDLSALETDVPGALVDGMWARVERAIDPAPAPARPLWNWLTAVQAAAIVLLAAGSLFLYGEVARLHGGERALTERVAFLEVESTAPPEAPAHGRLARYGNPTVAEARAALSRLPAGELLLGPEEAARLVERLGRPHVGTAPYLAGIRTDDGLDAGEALAIIDALDLSPDRRLPAGRILGGLYTYD